MRLVEGLFAYSHALTKAQKQDPSLRSLYIPGDTPGHEELKEVVQFRHNVLPELPVNSAFQAYIRAKSNESKKAGKPVVLIELTQAYKNLSTQEKEKYAALAKKDQKRFIEEVRKVVGISPL